MIPTIQQSYTKYIDNIRNKNVTYVFVKTVDIDLNMSFYINNNFLWRDIWGVFKDSNEKCRFCIKNLENHIVGKCVVLKYEGVFETHPGVNSYLWSVEKIIK